MKIIFLDVDGVLNAEVDFVTVDGRPNGKAPTLHTRSGCDYNGISQPRVKRLARIVGATGAKIVLCSSWKAYFERYRHKMDDDHVGKYLVNALGRQKLSVYDTTLHQELTAWWRGAAILAWIQSWDERHPEDPVESFVVLDDEWFDYEERHMTPYVVHTDYYESDRAKAGLNESHVETAISILSENRKSDIAKLIPKD